MGDVGSTVLGFTFAALPILAFRATGNPRFAICGVLCVSPFVFDTALTMLRRAIHRENILHAHRSHPRQRQRLVKLGYPHGTVSILYTALAFLPSLAGLAYLWGSDLMAGLALSGVVCLLLAYVGFVTWSERREEKGQRWLEKAESTGPRIVRQVKKGRELDI